MQILYQLGICFTRWRTGSTGRRGYALEMDKQLSKYNLSRKHCSAVNYSLYHQTRLSRLIWWAHVWCDEGCAEYWLSFLEGVKMPGVTRISSPVPRAGLVTASQTRGFLLHLLIKMRERMFYNLMGIFNPGQCSQDLSLSLSLTLDQFLIHARTFWNRTWLRIFLQNPLRKQIWRISLLLRIHWQ